MFLTWTIAGPGQVYY